MTQQQWEALMQQLAHAASEPNASRLCVGCWYREQDTPFPAARSSCLCATCAALVRELRGVPQPLTRVPPGPGGEV